MPPRSTAPASRTSVRLYRRIAIAFLGLTLILLGVVLAATLSRATIVITATEAPITADVKVTVASETKTSETVRGTVIASTEEGTRTAVPAGNGKTMQGHAKGTVLLVNKRNVSQPLVATTRLLSKDGVLLRLKSGVVLPPNGELKDVAVYADAIGPEGEIGPGTFTVPGLSGDLQKLVYAFSEKPTTGGVTTIRTVSEEDITAAAEALKDELTKKALANLTDQMSVRGLSGITSSVTETSRTVSAKAGDAVDSFTVSIKLAVSAVLYDREKLKNIGLHALNLNVSEEMDLRASNAEVVVPVVQNADSKTGSATLTAAFTGVAVVTPASAILNKDRLTGLDSQTIKGYLKSFDAIDEVAVSFSPFWVRHAPRLKDHIVIEVK